jgi:hypothetical protein
MIIDSSGRLGLGTSSPSYELSFGTGTSNLVSVGTTNAALRLRADGARSLQLYTNGENRLHINSAGAVGIGTTSPGTLLTLAGNNDASTNNNTLRFVDTDSSSSGTQESGRIEFFTSDSTQSGVHSYIAGQTTDVSGNGAITFGTGTAGSATESARIDSSGRLLVGTSSSPSASQGANSNLVVQGYVGQPTSGGIISLQRGQASASIASDQLIGRINFNGSDGYPFADITARTDAVAGVGDYPGALVFSTTAAGASSPTERMRITNAGATLIGTSTSNNNARLGVAGSTHIGAGANTVSLANGATGTVITPARGYSYINVSHSNTASDGLLLLVFANTTALTIVNTVHSNAGTRYSVSASGRDLQVTNALGSTASFYASCVTLAWGDNG